MSDSKLKRTLRISQKELDTLLDSMEQAPNARTTTSKRKAHRWTLRGPSVVLTVRTQIGGHTHFAVASRNLSSSGIGVIHGGYIHIGTVCVVSMRTKSGETRSMSGRVVKCRLTRGNFHDVGIAFDSPINPMDFIEPADHVAFNVENVNPQQLRGKVLVLDDDRAMQKLMAHYLRETALEANYANDYEAAVQCLADAPDIVFVDLHLPTKNGLDFIKEARSRHFMAPMIVLTADTAPNIRARVIEAGGTETLIKPISQELLHQALAEHLVVTANHSVPGGLIYCSLDRAQVPEDLVNGYIDELRKSADAIANAIEQNQVDALRRTVMNLRGTASGHGYEQITSIAAGALRVLEEKTTIADSLSELQQLIAACHRARPPRAETEASAEAPPEEKAA